MMPARLLRLLILTLVAMLLVLSAATIGNGFVPRVWLGPPSFVIAVSILAAFTLGVVAVSRRQSAVESWIARACHTARELAAGHLDARVPEPSVQQFADLASAMNEMALGLQQTTARLRRQAHHDALTGLPNRSYFALLANKLIQRHGTRGQVAVLFIDLDRFKVVNDSLGHPAGDALLQTVATRILAVIGTNCVCARLGGDEFTVMVVAPDAEQAAAVVASRIVRNLGRPFDIHGQRVFVGASIGIAASSGDELDVTELMRKADVALYRAKNSGRGRFFTYRPSLDQEPRDQLALDADLRAAIRGDQLDLVYQPVIELATCEVIGAEALIRWNHPHHGVLSPVDFIAMAQETGQIASVGAWVLDRACADLATLASHGGLGHSFTVAVNASATEFDDPALLTRIAQALDANAIPAARLKIEITESVLMENFQGASETLAALHEMGVGTAIDDFGTGYSSLSYLQDIRAESLKIDQSFVRRLGTNPQSDAIVTCIVQLGRSLGLFVIAEGVEEEHQASFLRAIGCDAAQGYYFARPLSVQDLGRFLSPSGRGLAGGAGSMRKAS